MTLEKLQCTSVHFAVCSSKFYSVSSNFCYRNRKMYEQAFTQKRIDCKNISLSFGVT